VLAGELSSLKFSRICECEQRRGDQPRKVLPPGKLPVLAVAVEPSAKARSTPADWTSDWDAAVIDNGDRYLVVATDPVTFATDHIGAYAVHVNANDVAVLGARPLWFFVVMLLPESRTTPELAATIMSDVRTTCDNLGVTLAGGHTEITQGLNRPILVGQMIITSKFAWRRSIRRFS
jgi:hydrogenase maturation factor